MRIDLDIRELRRLADDLGKAPKQAATDAYKVTVAESSTVHSRARAMAPRRRPWLSPQGIRRKSGRDAKGPWSIVYTAPDPRGRPVGFFQEYGTSKHPPQPFMTPAIEPAHQSYPDAIAKAVNPLGRSTGASATPGVSADG